MELIDRNIDLPKKKLKIIAKKLRLTDHAKQRIQERLNTNADIKQLIIDSNLAWYNKNDNTYNVCLNRDTYAVIAKNDNGYAVITVKEASRNGVSVRRKYELSQLNKKDKYAETRRRND